MSLRPELTPYTIVVTRVADKQIAALSSENELRVVIALERLALTAHGDTVDVGHELLGTLRLRVGNLRIYLDVSERTIIVRGIEKRGEAYRKKSRR